MKRIKVAIVGAGKFSHDFAPLFKAHPLVKDISLVELMPERRDEFAKAYGISETYSNYEEALKSDADAVAIITQRQLHGQQAIAALKAGKHVYSSVPMAICIEEAAKICELAKQTGLVYMVGETSYYYPCTIYCRERMSNGDFGRFVYGEAQYLHDMSHGFYDSFKRSGGDTWKRLAGIQPMYYPTHTISMIVSVTGSRIEKVSCA